MSVLQGELGDAWKDPKLAERQIDGGFRIVRGVLSRGLTEITNTLTTTVNRSRGDFGFIKREQSFRQGLQILRDSMIRRGLVDGGQGAMWEQMKSRDLRNQLEFMAGVARNARLPTTIPARIPSFYYDRTAHPTYPIQYIRCRPEPVGDIDLSQQQTVERSLLIRESIGFALESQESTEEDEGVDGVLTYARFPPNASESTVRGIVATLNGHAEDVGIAVTVTPLLYNVYS